MDVQNEQIAADTQVVEQAATQQQEQKVDDYDPTSFYENDQQEPVEPEQTEGQEGDEQGETGEEGDEQADAIDAPISWAKDAKDVFAKLPREAQEIIATRERERETFLQAKSRETAQTRQTVESEARAVLHQFTMNYKQQLERYDSFFTPQEPDLRLLNSDDPAHRTLYFQQEAAYRSATAQREHLAQQVREAEQHAQVIAQQQQQAEFQAEHALLEEKLGQDWSDSSSRAKLLETLTPIAAELGYSTEQIAQARACDILAMRHVSELKVKADKYDALQKTKMAQVRAAKNGSPIPPTARPAAPNGSRAPVSVEAMLYPNDVRR